MEWEVLSWPLTSAHRKAWEMKIMFIMALYFIQLYCLFLNWFKKKKKILFWNSPSLVLNSHVTFFFFFLPAMCSVSFYSEITMRISAQPAFAYNAWHTPWGSLRTGSLEKQGSHSWPVTMEADAVFFLPLLTSLQPRAAPYC